LGLVAVSWALIAVPGAVEGSFRQINTALTGDECHRIGERNGIRMVPP
jgi:hypothetical protein